MINNPKMNEIVMKELDAFNRHDADAFAALYADDSNNYDPMYDKPLVGRAAVRKDIADFFLAFPDVQAKLISPILTSENIAAFEVSITGTNTGRLVTSMGKLPPTKRALTMVGGRFIHTTPDGMIRACNRYYDMMTILMQLGLIKKAMIILGLIFVALIAFATAQWWWPGV